MLFENSLCGLWQWKWICFPIFEKFKVACWGVGTFDYNFILISTRWKFVELSHKLKEIVCIVKEEALHEVCINWYMYLGEFIVDWMLLDCLIISWILFESHGILNVLICHFAFFFDAMLAILFLQWSILRKFKLQATNK